MIKIIYRYTHWLLTSFFPTIVIVEHIRTPIYAVSTAAPLYPCHHIPHPYLHPISLPVLGLRIPSTTTHHSISYIFPNIPRGYYSPHHAGGDECHVRNRDEHLHESTELFHWNGCYRFFALLASPRIANPEH